MAKEGLIFDVTQEEDDVLSALLPIEGESEKVSEKEGFTLEEPSDSLIDAIIGEKEIVPIEGVIVDEKETVTESLSEPVSDAVKAPKVEFDSDLEYRKGVFKALSKNLIENKLWKDVEGGIDELDLDDESFVAFTNLQIENAVEERSKNFIDELTATNDIVAGIIKFQQTGGNMDEILDLFKERQSVLKQDWDSEEGAIKGIKKYYKDFQNWDEAKINKYIKNLEADEEGEIEKEKEFVKSKINEHYKKEQELLESREFERQRAEKEIQETKIANSYNILKEGGFSEKDTNSLLGQVFQPKYKTKEGEILTELDAQILKIKSNEKELLEFAQFVLNKDKYKKSLTQTVKNETTSSIFQNLKAPVKKATDTIIPDKKVKDEKDKEAYDQYKKFGQQVTFV